MGREAIQKLEESKQKKNLKLGRREKAEIIRGVSGRACKYICEIVNCHLKAYPKNL